MLLRREEVIALVYQACPDLLIQSGDVSRYSLECALKNVEASIEQRQSEVNRAREILAKFWDGV